ncbi:MAG: ABC transporter permease [Thermoanaerobaculia bacterium]
MFEVIKNFAIKEFLQIKRDKRMLFFIFMPPIIQLFIFGYGLTYDIKNIPVAYCDLDKTFESREILRKISSSGYFNLKYSAGSPFELEKIIEKGKAMVSIQINDGFSEDLKKGKRAEIQVIIDGTDVNTSKIASGYLNKITSSISIKDTKKIPLDFKIRVWYNPELKSRNYIIPGIIAMLIMLSCLLLTAMSIVKEREVGTLEQILVTPIKPLEFILGKTIPFMIIGYLEMFLVLFFALFIFKIPLKGSFILLFFVSGIYILNALGIGIFISTISKTLRQAMMGSFFFFFPAIILSGFIFPIENMPEGLQYLTYINPLRYFLIIIRGIFLKSSGFFTLFNEIFFLTLISIGIFSLSLFNFSKRIQ